MTRQSSTSVVVRDGLVPRWTARVSAESSGRDPLGLSRVSGIIADYLLFGIASTTDRARYFSFFCWALWHIGQDQPKRFSEFVTQLRRREAVLALATIANDPQSSPVGVTATKIEWQKGLKAGRFNTDFRVLPSNLLGAYGQYYSGSLANLGMVERDERGFDRPDPTIAASLAAAVHSSLSKTPYIRKGLFATDSIMRADLRSTAKYMTIDALSAEFAVGERRTLRDVFFAVPDRFSTDRHLMRRRTLLHIMHVLSQYERLEVEIPLREIDWYIGYPVYYYDLLKSNGKRGVRYNTPASLQQCHSLWRQFSAHQFLADAIETLLWATLEELGRRRSGLSARELAEALLSSEVFKHLKELTGRPCKAPADLLRSAEAAVAATSKDARGSLSDPLGEYSLAEATDRTSVPHEVARALAMLAVLRARWRVADDAMRFVAMSAPHELWLGTVLPLLERWMKPEGDWPKCAEELVATCILAQHDSVMYDKRSLNRSWLNRGPDGRVFKEQDYEPTVRTSRHSSALGILADLGLLQTSRNRCTGLTRDGTRLLDRFLR
jgi:hypothetical protein